MELTILRTVDANEMAVDGYMYGDTIYSKHTE